MYPNAHASWRSRWLFLASSRHLRHVHTPVLRQRVLNPLPPTSVWRRLYILLMHSIRAAILMNRGSMLWYSTDWHITRPSIVLPIHITHQYEAKVFSLLFLKVKGIRMVFCLKNGITQPCKFHLVVPIFSPNTMQ